MKFQTSRRGFLKSSGLVAVTVAVPSSLWGCGSKSKSENTVPEGNGAGGEPDTSAWEAKAKELEGNGILTADSPGKWDGKQGGHVPKVTFNEGEGTVTVETTHGMSEEHWITTQYVRDQNGKVVGLESFQGTDPKALSTFQVPEGTTELTAYSHCNLHDHWKAAPWTA